jgi:hypothetical protein
MTCIVLSVIYLGMYGISGLENETFFICSQIWLAASMLMSTHEY